MKTIKVKPWGEGQGEFVVINVDDLTEGHEVISEDGTVDPAVEKRALSDSIIAKIFARRAGISLDAWYALPIEEHIDQLRKAEIEIDGAAPVDEIQDALRVAKGPGGRLYLKRGKETVGGPFENEEAAQAAMQELLNQEAGARQTGDQ
ncbi:hypothetical protein [Labrys sp. ZIDIC5]|uniref:hypothetical protein n=1 Tax=Labrys sedimenti TaxID=3106036 RepID=UPI002ACA7ECD|nr:hypothetical protein [Labrys sp. ZIDIC5]MDZ5448946.1 hypothetical protein [Labrys sp. ZIDIC5]